MARLIDADAFIRYIGANRYRDGGERVFSEFDVVEMINEQPIAYNVDEVVEQLEEEREYSYANFYDYVEDCSPCLDAEYDDYFHRGIERAIKIMKAGGKE